MKINFSKQQFDTLLEMMELGYLVTSSNDQTGNESKFIEMEQYLMSFAKDFEVEDVLYDSQNQLYGLTAEREQEIQRVINEYEDLVFWDKLVYYLARRDFTNEMTAKPLDEETAFQRLIEIQEKYHHYFEKHGIQYLKIEK